MDLIDGFLLSRRAERRSPKTLTAYQQNLCRLVFWFGLQKMHNPIITLITPEHLRQFLAYLQTTDRWTGKGITAHHPASPATVDTYYRLLRNFFNWAVAEGFLEKSPMAHTHAPKMSDQIIETFSQQQLQALLDRCSNDFVGVRNKAIIFTLVDTGGRLAEIANLDVADIELNNSRMRVVGKGNREDWVYIGARTQKALWRYLLARKGSPLPELWLNQQGEPLKNAHAIQIMLRRLGKRAGIQGVRCSPHTFRHTFAISFLRAGGDAFNLQRLLRHKSLDMVRRYLSSLKDEDAAQAHRRASPADQMRLK